MSNIIISEYKPEYRQDIIDMILQIQQVEFDLPISIKDQPDLEDIENFYQKKGNFWVALCDGKVAGTIALINIGNGDGALRKMFVKQEYRGKDKGVSASLLSCLLNWAKESSYTRIFLGTTPQFLAAHRFYEKNNFAKIQKDELPETFPVMKVDKLFYRYIIK